MKQVSERDALKDLSRYLRDMYCWCDYKGSYTGDTIEVLRANVKQMRRLVDSILSGKVNVADGYDSVYAQLVNSRDGQNGRV